MLRYALLLFFLFFWLAFKPNGSDVVHNIIQLRGHILWDQVT